jgi:hypothetical protein
VSGIGGSLSLTARDSQHTFTRSCAGRCRTGPECALWISLSWKAGSRHRNADSAGFNDQPSGSFQQHDRCTALSRGRRSPWLRVVPRGHHEVGAVGASLRAARPQRGQRYVTAATRGAQRIRLGAGRSIGLVISTIRRTGLLLAPSMPVNSSALRRCHARRPRLACDAASVAMRRMRFEAVTQRRYRPETGGLAGVGPPSHAAHYGLWVVARRRARAVRDLPVTTARLRNRPA